MYCIACPLRLLRETAASLPCCRRERLFLAASPDRCSEHHSAILPSGFYFPIGALSHSACVRCLRAMLLCMFRRSVFSLLQGSLPAKFTRKLFKIVLFVGWSLLFLCLFVVSFFFLLL